MPQRFVEQANTVEYVSAVNGRGHMWDVSDRLFVLEAVLSSFAPAQPDVADPAEHNVEVVVGREAIERRLEPARAPSVVGIEERHELAASLS